MKTVYFIDFHFKLHNKGIRTKVLQLAFVITCFRLNRQSPINERSLPVGRGGAHAPVAPPPLPTGLTDIHQDLQHLEMRPENRNASFLSTHFSVFEIILVNHALSCPMKHNIHRTGHEKNLK